ncbi:MAG: LPS-assembly protein LptD [Hyphomonadaceae bacterium]
MVRSGETADRLAERTPSYWAALAAAVVASVAPAAAHAQTTEPAAPAAAPAPDGAEEQAADQTDRVLLEADVIINDDPAQTVTAEGDVQLRYQGRTMRADRLVYNLETGIVVAEGNVQIVEADGSATYAERVEADDALNVAVANELRARLGTAGTLAARSVLRSGPGESELHNIIYTSCPICVGGDRPPTWSLRARRAVQDRETQTISYRGATVEVLGVPILYLPFFAHADPSVGRASGLMPPRIGQDGSLGAYYRQPYYWAFSPSADVTPWAQVHSNIRPLYGVDYRQRFFSGYLQAEASFAYEQEFDSKGNTFGEDTWRSHLFANGRFAINDYWNWGFGAERVSDDLYLRRYDLPGTGRRRGLYIGTETRLLSQLYAVGQDESSYNQLALISFQGLRANDSADLMPLILPFGDAERVFRDPLFGGQLRVQGATAVLQRSLGPDSARGSVSATWRTDTIVGPGIVFSPFAQARADLYRVETTPDEYESFSRGLGYAGAEVSWPFMRPGENFDVIVEPVVMAAYASENTENDRIINEDSLSFELDDSNLFRANAAPNYDLWEPGGRVSVGVRATARARNGRSASLLFGRRWRDEPAPGFSAVNNLEGEASDWVGSVSADLGRNFATDFRFRLEDETWDVQRIDMGVRGSWNRFSAQARYYTINDVLAPGNPNEELAGAVTMELARGWRMQLGVRRDLDSDINLTQDIRAIYEDDCTFLEIAYTRSETLDRTLGPREGLQIRVGLRSLGVLGGG